jgi:hypothetical protein
LSRQKRTRLRSSLVTDREDKIQLRGRSGEFLPTLTAQSVNGKPQLPQQFERHGMNLAFRMAAGAVRLELVARDMVHHRFSEDGAGRIASAQKEDAMHSTKDRNMPPMMVWWRV